MNIYQAGKTVIDDAVADIDCQKFESATGRWDLQPVGYAGDLLVRLGLDWHGGIVLALAEKANSSTHKRRVTIGADFPDHVKHNLVVSIVGEFFHALKHDEIEVAA